MRIVEIAPLSNGAHRNQTIIGNVNPSDGWAIIPDGIATENFPFGIVEAAEIDGVMTVTSWAPGTIPDPEPDPAPPPTAEEDRDAMLVDHEYRLTLLELGVTEEV